MVEHMLSTIDNPYNPFTHFDEWNNWDMNHGYHTIAFQARIAITSDELSPADESQAIEDAINEIVQENVTGVYIRVTPDYVPRGITVVA